MSIKLYDEMASLTGRLMADEEYLEVSRPGEAFLTGIVELLYADNPRFNEVRFRLAVSIAKLQRAKTLSAPRTDEG